MDIPLEELLQGDKMQEYVNRPNYEGPFAIHLSADMKSTLLLMKAGAKQYRNKEGDQILQKQSGPAPHLLRPSHSTALTSQNKQDQSLLSELKPDLFKKVALWKKQNFEFHPLDQRGKCFQVDPTNRRW